MMKSILVVFLFSLAAMAEDTIDCKRQELLAAQQEVIKKMSIEEINTALEEAKAKIDANNKDEIDQQRSVELAELLEKIEKVGKVKIENCTELSIKEETPEAQKLLAQIKEYCANSPQNFWAEMTKTGDIKFSFATGTTNGTNALTIGGSAGITLGYRGNEIKLAGDISKASVGSGAQRTSTGKYNATADYARNLGLTNLESFIKWKGSRESTKTPEGDSEIERNVIDLGLRYSIFNTETLNMKVGAGAGLNHLNQGGSLLENNDRLAPSISAAYDFKAKPNQQVELFLNINAQRDVGIKNPSTIYGGKLGGKFLMGPIGAGLEYGADYDSARTGSKINHQFSAFLSASLDPDSWRDAEKVKKEKEAKERERVVWENTLERLKK